MPLAVIVLDPQGAVLERADVKGGEAKLNVPREQLVRARVFVVPSVPELKEMAPSARVLQSLGAYEPILFPGGGRLTDVIEIPGSIIDLWPLCLCLVRGRVVRASDGRAVCDARVHICEVDRIPLWLRDLPDLDILKLRDDLIDAIRKPPIPPRPVPPEPGPIPPGPGPDPAPFDKALVRLASAPDPGDSAKLQIRSTEIPELPLDLQVRLVSRSVSIVREALVVNWRLIFPYLCLWPRWWSFRCDEVAVRTTDANGRFEAVIPYACGGDKPDLYFWVEYDLGAGLETVYEPPIACWTYWDYPCGSEVTLRVADPRVPACSDEPDLSGKQVWVVSVGRTVSIGEIHTSGPTEGMVTEPFGGGPENYAFGEKIEPRVWFGRTALLGDGITHYLWSVRKQGGAESDWTPLDRQVIRHYTTPGGTAPVAVMGPEPGGANVGRFRIRPADPPAGGIEWLIADEREDLASAHLVTHVPPAPPPPAPSCGVEDLDAGKYELKLELFDSTGTLVVWEDRGIALRIATNEAPFGTGTVDTVAAGNYHRIKNASNKTVAFRMILHVDNSRCAADVQAITGSGISVDSTCGVVTLTGPAPTIDVGFSAGRPGGLARFDFDTTRGLSTPVTDASTSGRVDDPATPSDSGVGSFVRSGCTFTRGGLSASSLLGGCDQAAFAEHLHVWALSQNGYNRLSGLDAHDVAAFMLTEPCPPGDA